MNKPEYSIYINGEIQEIFDGRSSTYDRDEAFMKYEEVVQNCSNVGNRIDLKVSARGITTTIKSEERNKCSEIAESIPTYTAYTKEANEAFIALLCELHEAGYSAPEIADITGRTTRVVNYNIKKLIDRGMLKSHGKGRPSDDVVRDKKSVTIQLYKDNYEFLMSRYGNVSGVINDLVDEYKKLVENGKE